MYKELYFKQCPLYMYLLKDSHKTTDETCQTSEMLLKVCIMFHFLVLKQLQLHVDMFEDHTNLNIGIIKGQKKNKIHLPSMPENFSFHLPPLKGIHTNCFCASFLTAHTNSQPTSCMSMHTEFSYC